MIPLETEGELLDKTQLELVRGTLDVLILKALAWGSCTGMRSRTSSCVRPTGRCWWRRYAVPGAVATGEQGPGGGGMGAFRKQSKGQVLPADPNSRRQLRRGTKTWEAYAAAVGKMLGATRPPLPEQG